MPIYNLCMCMMHAASARLSSPAGQNIIVPVYRTTPAVKSGRARPISRPRSESDVRTKPGPAACCTEHGRRNLTAPRSSSIAAGYQCLSKNWPQGGPPRPQNRVQKSAAEARSRSHSIGPNSILKPKQKRQTTFSRGHITAYGKRP